MTCITVLCHSLTKQLLLFDFLSMDNNSSQGLLADSFRSPEIPTSPYDQRKEHSDIRYLPISHQSQDGMYDRVPGTEAGHPSPALSSLASPGPFKSLEQVRSFHEMKESDVVWSPLPFPYPFSPPPLSYLLLLPTRSSNFPTRLTPAHSRSSNAASAALNSSSASPPSSSPST